MWLAVGLTWHAEQQSQYSVVVLSVTGGIQTGVSVRVIVGRMVGSAPQATCQPSRSRGRLWGCPLLTLVLPSPKECRLECHNET